MVKRRSRSPSQKQYSETDNLEFTGTFSKFNKLSDSEIDNPFKPGEKKQISDATSFAIYSVIEGSLRLDEQILATGDSFIYPAIRRKMTMDFFGEVNTKIIGISIPIE